MKLLFWNVCSTCRQPEKNAVLQTSPSSKPRDVTLQQVSLTSPPVLCEQSRCGHVTDSVLLKNIFSLLINSPHICSAIQGFFFFLSCKQHTHTRVLLKNTQPPTCCNNNSRAGINNLYVRLYKTVDSGELHLRAVLQFVVVFFSKWSSHLTGSCRVMVNVLWVIMVDTGL